MLRIGLTGGIGCGKSTVTERFRRLGAPVIDSDVIARDLVRPGSPALQAIETRFGPEMLRDDGELDRAALRDRIFADDAARRQLNAIMHPRVREAITAQAAGLVGDYCIIVIPLLVESGMTELVDRVLVVDCARETQFERLLGREGMTTDLAEAMIASQATREQRLQFADDIIDNDATIDRLERQVEALDRKYRALAHAMDA
jgi:dephospho-CoA kinase